MNQSMIVRDDRGLTVAFTAEAERLKLDALENCALIGQVTNPDENTGAVACMKELQTLLNETEKARKACKQPVLDYGRLIDEKRGHLSVISTSNEIDCRIW